MKLLLCNGQSPGDGLMLTACVRDLKRSHPEISVNVSTSYDALFENNPLLDRSITAKNADKVIKMEYPAIHRSNERGLHFVYAFQEFLEQALGITIERGEACCDVYLNDQEKHIFDSMPRKMAIIDAGHKQDFTAKFWEFARFQEVVDRTKDKFYWVQIGAGNHNHKPLRNVENLVGRTTHRQFLALMWQASMVLTPVSYPMHLATMPWKYGDKRPCVVIAGGREPASWEAYAGHQYLHRCGCYPCCAKGGCWRSRVVPLKDGSTKDQSLCDYPTKTDSGQIIPRCMDSITVDEVVAAIERYEL